MKTSTLKREPVESDWIKIVPTGAGTRTCCTRCGKHLDFNLPTGSRFWLVSQEQFYAQHEKCEARSH